MAMINIEYRHTKADIPDPSIRRTTTSAMKQYIQDLVFEMEMADISVKFTETVTESGDNTVFINGRTVPEIIDGLEIKHLEVEESCDLGSGGRVTFGRPTLDWKEKYIEDVPDTIMKNAIAKVYADELENRIDVVQNN